MVAQEKSAWADRKTGKANEAVKQKGILTYIVNSVQIIIYYSVSYFYFSSLINVVYLMLSI